MNYDHNKKLGYLNFSQAIENYISTAKRAIVEKLINTQTINTVKSFIFMGTNFRGLKMMDMFMITWKSWILEKQQLPFK